ncbi:hypothetical protein FB451DRAFT_1186270 [Mycena latifolia]|nr:hypothetical protein FB451DRAFT_1186270 [Mycena latifolia]
MAHQSPSQSALATFPMKRRAPVACVNCRKRKVKCIPPADSPHNPCERCTRRSLQCEYRSVADEVSLYNSSRDGSSMNPVQTATPGLYMRPPIQSHGGQREFGAVSSPHSSAAHSNTSHFYSPTTPPTPAYPYMPNALHHPHQIYGGFDGPATGPSPEYWATQSNYNPMNPTSSRVQAAPARPSQQHDSHGYHVDYAQMFHDPGLHNYVTSDTLSRQAHVRGLISV